MRHMRGVGQKPLIWPLDRAEIFPDATRTAVDLRGDTRGPPRATARTHALSCRRRADPTACEDQRGGKPVRSPMGSVLRRTRRRADDTQPEMSTATAVPLETPRGSLPCLPSEDHQTDG